MEKESVAVEWMLVEWWITLSKNWLILYVTNLILQSWKCSGIPYHVEVTCKMVKGWTI